MLHHRTAEERVESQHFHEDAPQEREKRCGTVAESFVQRLPRMGENAKCSRWRGNLKPGGLAFLRSPTFADPCAGLKPRIRYLGVFQDKQVRDSHFVEVWSKPRTMARMQVVMNKIFGEWIEGLEPMSGGRAFCEKEPVFSIGQKR